MMTKGKKMIQPDFLKPGDKVAFISPGYWMPQEAIVQAAETIRSWGLEPVIGQHSNSLNVSAFAGTADERASDLIEALKDDSIKAIVCSRGGYGSIHLLKRVAQELFCQHPKWLIGHGDISILLYAMTEAGVMSLHGPMAFQIAGCQEPITSITRDLLFGTIPQYKVPAHANNQMGHAEGVLVGGNLSSYSAISGTIYHLPPKQDVILYIEEVEESLHGIDRLFYTLTLQEDFERVKGVIFGTFNSIRYDLQFGSVEQMLIPHLRGRNIPVCCGFPVGGNDSVPLIEGAPSVLDVTPEGASLTFKIEGKVEPREIGVNKNLFREENL
jgi:muramoyltetrapeptide carboxypeptidase